MGETIRKVAKSEAIFLMKKRKENFSRFSLSIQFFFFAWYDLGLSSEKMVTCGMATWQEWAKSLKEMHAQLLLSYN